ncbi:arginase family protein [Niabella soli]|uniref:Arginase n=1 Tax=Niabella soli DSM 19437 TaxID=929713 RepID=W0EZB6_9BACT|nr:arginase family protein [Niabella soli]AHF16107.1 arginase [Niabella soli DSM 19437]
MSDHLNIEAFLSPVNLIAIAGDTIYQSNQVGSSIAIYDVEFPDLELTELVLVGCGEQRGNGVLGAPGAAPDCIRRQFYSLFFWHEGIKIADIGDVKQGASYTDTIAALRTVIAALIDEGKMVIVLGGSHDLTMAQYGACALQKKVMDISVVDAIIDLDMESPFPNDHFLMEMLTGEPNYIRHYNHIGFQSYLVHPGMLQTLDKLKFDFHRVGHVKEDIEQMEPSIRGSQLLSFDVNAIANAYAPANLLTPNGLNGEEACILMQYAGMSTAMQTIGIFGYDAKNDRDELTAKQIGHMLWYAIDGVHRKKKEAALEERESFNEYEVIFSETATRFLQSKKTGRWWMELSNKHFVPCSYNDYQLAANGEIPERWFREHQR